MAVEVRLLFGSFPFISRKRETVKWTLGGKTVKAYKIGYNWIFLTLFVILRMDENKYWRWPKNDPVCSENAAAFRDFKYLFRSMEYAQEHWKSTNKLWLRRLINDKLGLIKMKQYQET